MSQFTITVKQMIENNVDIFKFNYPIFDETYRPILEQNIINHFYYREIGCETVGQFIHRLKTKMNLIMPFYNRMYESDRLEYDPLSNYDVTEIIKELGNENTTGTGDNTNTENVQSSSKKLHSDTPSGRLTIGENYVSDIEEVDGNGLTTNTNRNNSNLETARNKDTTRTMKGNIGVMTSQDLVMKYRQTFTRLDEGIIGELNELFMLIY